MNDLGIMVDISHVSDKTFYDVIAATRTPVIASHSSCKVFANMPRNMTDDMISALAKNGGVIHINFHEGFLDQAYVDARAKCQAEFDKQEADANAKFKDDPAGLAREMRRITALQEERLPRPGVAKV